MRKVICVAATTSAFLLVHEAVAQDVTRGKALFEACAPCHQLGEASTELGPTLIGIVGRKAGARDDFRYSRALSGAQIVWDEATLDAFLTHPQALITGTRMPFAGLADKSERTDLISYLRTVR
jgi:cytochrome c